MLKPYKELIKDLMHNQNYNTHLHSATAIMKNGSRFSLNYRNLKQHTTTKNNSSNRKTELFKPLALNILKMANENHYSLTPNIHKKTPKMLGITVKLLSLN
jgi:hypothetical protein